MRSGGRFVIVVLALALSRAGHAATLITTDFNKDAKGWVLNGNARVARLTEAKVVSLGDAKLEQVLELTSSKEAQAGVAWTELKQKVPSFSFIADVRVRYDGGAPIECPADGFTLAFAAAEKDACGEYGGALGLFNGASEQFTAFEVNTFHWQGLGTEEERKDCKSDKHVTFAFDVVGPDTKSDRVARKSGTPENGGAKIGQELPPDGMKIVNGGWYRYQWNVAENRTMTVTITGLEEGNGKFRKAKVLEVKFPDGKAIDFEGRWGLTAATGAGFQTVEVARARVEAPMIEP